MSRFALQTYPDTVAEALIGCSILSLRHCDGMFSLTYGHFQFDRQWTSLSAALDVYEEERHAITLGMEVDEPFSGWHRRPTWQKTASAIS